MDGSGSSAMWRYCGVQENRGELLRQHTDGSKAKHYFRFIEKAKIIYLELVDRVLLLDAAANYSFS